MTAEPLSRIAHDPDAFELFYREHLEVVLRFITRRVVDPHLAADLTADVFLAVIDNAASYDPRRGDPRAWVFGVARNVVSAENRRVARDVQLRRRVAGRRLLVDDDIERLQEQIDAARDSRALVAAMARLPDSERAVLELVAVDQLTVTEAATALGIRAVTARVRLHRARTSLRASTATCEDPSPVTTPTSTLTPVLEPS
jgi:RNA polymerase sigma-70 factor (ECF subfamily)